MAIRRRTSLDVKRKDRYTLAVPYRNRFSFKPTWRGHSLISPILALLLAISLLYTLLPSHMQALDINRVDPARSLPDLHRIRPLIPTASTRYKWINDDFVEGYQRGQFLYADEHGRSTRFDGRSPREIRGAVVSAQVVEPHRSGPEYTMPSWPLRPSSVPTNESAYQFQATLLFYDFPVDEGFFKLPQDLFARGLDNKFPEFEIEVRIARSRDETYRTLFGQYVILDAVSGDADGYSRLWQAPSLSHVRVFADIPDNFWIADQATLDNDPFSAIIVVKRNHLVARFHISLHRETLGPRRKFAVCSKSWYSADYAKMIEWREHHRLLGFDVHWAFQDARHRKFIEALNEATGGDDSFMWRPRVEDDPSLPPFWDEWMTVAACFYEQKPHYDYIGIWDVDEFLAPVFPREDWNKYVANFLDHFPNIGSLIIPDLLMGGTDQTEPFSSKELSIVIPQASATELQAITKLSMVSRKCTFTSEIHGVYQLHKSLHRTDSIESVGPHRHEGYLITEKKQAWIEHLAPAGQGLQLLHRKKTFDLLSLIGLEHVVNCPVDTYQVQWWRDLHSRIAAIRLRMSPTYF